MEYRFYVDPPPFDAETPALIAGDCIFNLRASLDHLVYALWARHCRGTVPEDQVERPQFPIYTDPQAITTDQWRSIGELGLKQRRAIEFLQPYHRWNDKFRWTRERLADLARLNNIDKHRYLHIARVSNLFVPVPWMTENNPYGFRHQSFFVPLEGKTEVFRWIFDAIPVDIAKQVEMHSEIRAAITLDEGREQMALVPLLQAIVNAVETVLRRFELFFR